MYLSSLISTSFICTVTIHSTGRKAAVTTCTFSRDGKLIAGAMVDGSIQLWNSSGPYVCQKSRVHMYTVYDTY